MNALYGVNVGGWLVLERWITPGVFRGTDATDEHSLAHDLGKKEFQKRITHHRDTFITEKHIQQLAQRGIQSLRVPVGYWLLESQDGFLAADRYVTKLFDWAKKYNLKVILDLHAPKGSQNGWDHSGRAGAIEWRDTPVLATKDALEFISLLAERYGHREELVGVEVLNEPHWEVDIEQLITYYQRAHDIIQRHCHEDVTTIFSDAFRPEEMAKQLSKLQLHNVVLDIHLYQLFTPEDQALSLEGHIKKVRKEWSKLLKNTTKMLPVMVGEWSSAMSEMYNPATNKKTYTYSLQDYAAYHTVQRQIFLAAGCPNFYWTARTEDGGVWSLVDQPDFVR